MNGLSDLGRSWTNMLTAVSVGSLTLLLPLMSTIDYRSGSVSIQPAAALDLLAPLNAGANAASVVLSLLFLGISLAAGSIVIQFGELFALAMERSRGNSRTKARLVEVASSPVLIQMYQDAYAGFRALCGFGGLVVLASGNVILSGIIHLHAKIVALGLFGTLLGIVIAGWFARYAFTYIDWIIFGQLEE